MRKTVSWLLQGIICLTLGFLCSKVTAQAPPVPHMIETLNMLDMNNGAIDTPVDVWAQTDKGRIFFTNIKVAGLIADGNVLVFRHKKILYMTNEWTVRKKNK